MPHAILDQRTDWLFISPVRRQQRCNTDMSPQYSRTLLTPLQGTAPWRALNMTRLSVSVTGKWRDFISQALTKVWHDWLVFFTPSSRTLHSFLFLLISVSWVNTQGNTIQKDSSCIQNRNTDKLKTKWSSFLDLTLEWDGNGESLPWKCLVWFFSPHLWLCQPISRYTSLSLIWPASWSSG